MAKVINLKPQEDITSVIERLWETGEEEVFLVAPNESVLLKNIIALKLLKREADRLGKEVTLITKDTLGREMAKRVGLVSRVVLPKSKALAMAAEADQEVFREVPPRDFENMLEDEVRAKRENPEAARRFSDIRPKSAIVERRSLELGQEEEKIAIPLEEETPVAEEAIQPEKEEEIADRISFKNFYFPKHREDKVEEELKPEEREPEPEEIPDESKDGGEDGTEEFPIHGMADGSRRILVKEKKPFFSWLPSFNFNKVKEALKIEEIKPEKRKKKATIPIFSGKFLGLFAGAVLLVALLALYLILPEAKVSVSAKTEAVNLDLTIIADKGVSKIDSSLNKIPAQLIKLDKRQSQEFATTGQRQVNDKAKGTLTIYNEFSSSPQVLVEKTRFVAEGGQVFRLVKSLTVPGAKIQDGKIVASSIEAEVVADQSGSEYNVAPSRFTIPGFQGTPKYSTFYGQSKSAMSGGAAGLMKVISQDDYDKAKDTLWQSLRPALDSEFKSQLPGELKILDGASKEEISGTEINLAVGSPAEKFTMTLKGTAVAVLFDAKDVLEVVKKKLADKLGDDKDLALASDQVSYQLAAIDYSRGQASMKIKSAGSLVWKINTDSLKREIVGQNEKAIRDIFAKHSEVEEAKVVFWPFWVASAPSNLDKVIIQVNK